MNHHEQTFTPAGRCCLGLLMGTGFGFLVELMFFWERPPEGTVAIPWRGPMMGALITAAIVVFFGERTLPGWLAVPVGWCLGGTIVGILGGALLFAPLMTSLTDPHGPFNGKTMGTFQFIGVICGAILGCVLGLTVGILRYALGPRNGEAQSGPSPATPDATNASV
jgi:hypothetical protein